MALGGALPSPVLDHLLHQAAALVDQVANAPLPQTMEELAATYARLGQGVAGAEAALLGALDALDPKTGGGAAKPAGPYERIRAAAFARLQTSGAAFAKMSAAFDALVHTGHAWPARPVVLAQDRGDGQPLRAYENTFKNAASLTPAQRHAEFDARVSKFQARGGRFEDIITAHAGVFQELPSNLRHDYVLLPDGTLRLFPNEKDDDSGPVKPGHSLLAEGGPSFGDHKALLAGELWVLKDSAGDVEAVMVANNSGHFKPGFEDLPNAIPALMRLGIPKEKIVLMGGPNNLDAMFREMGAKDPAITPRLPPNPWDILASTAQRPSHSPLALRLEQAG